MITYERLGEANRNVSDTNDRVEEDEAKEEEEVKIKEQTGSGREEVVVVEVVGETSSF
jgi:translation initiation factor 1 (eIF-1/SUI1)